MQNRRKNYFIDKGFQTKFILKFCSLVILGSFLIGLLIYLFNMQTTTVAFENLKIDVKTTADFILPIILQILIFVTSATAVASILVLIFTSHRISGPIYKIKNELKRIKGGDLSVPIQIRANDQLRELVNEFEELRLTLKKSNIELNDKVLELKNLLSSTKLSKKDEINKLVCDIEKVLSKQN